MANNSHPVLVLGCAQLGMSYGVTNRHGQLSYEEAGQILQSLADEPGAMVDTAPVYGRSEEILGELLPDNVGICTKSCGLSDVTDFKRVKSELGNGLAASLRRLKRDRVDVFLLHQPELLKQPWIAELFSWLDGLKQSGRISLFGASIYDNHQLTPDLAAEYNLDVIQRPMNLLDQSALHNNWLSQCQSEGVQVQIRSVFLQGLLLAPDKSKMSIPGLLKNQIASLQQLSHREGVSVASLAVDCVRRQRPDQIVMGVSSMSEWQELMALWKTPVTNVYDYSRYALENEPYLNPANWPQNQT